MWNNVTKIWRKEGRVENYLIKKKSCLIVKDYKI